MSDTQAVFEKYNCLPDTGADVTEGLQRAVLELLHKGHPVVFPPGTYKISDTIEFFCDEPGVRTAVLGHGVTIDCHIPDQPWDINQEQEDDEEWQDIRDANYKSAFHFMRKPHEWHVTVEGFKIDTNSKVGVIALDTAGITQSAFRDMDLIGFIGIRPEGWTCTYENLVCKSGFIGMWLYSGSRGLNSNANIVSNCRVYGGKWAYNKHGIKPFAHMVVEGGGNTITGRCTHEGNASRYQVWTGLERNAAYELTIDDIHTEIQGWEGVEREEARSVGMAEQRHKLFLNWAMRYGLRSFKDKLGNIIVQNVTIGDKRHNMPRRWEGVGRNVIIYATTEHGAWHGQESVDKYLDALGVERARLVINGHPAQHS